MQIYKYISDICAKREISIAKLEKDVGFALGTVRRWGAVMPSVDKMVKVADYLNVTVDELCGRSVDEDYIKNIVKDLTKQSPDEAMLLRMYQLIPEEYRMEALYAVMEIKMKHEKE